MPVKLNELLAQLCRRERTGNSFEHQNVQVFPTVVVRLNHLFAEKLQRITR